jgi:hypothetical protein
MKSHIDARLPSPPEEKLKTVAASAVAPRSEDFIFSGSALSSCGDFLRQNAFRVLAVSTAVLIPCFWHRRIEAGDLASHTYNAWLAQLIARGEAPGLFIAKQWNNVLFDVCLSHLGTLIGLGLAEKICVSAAVLIFFWGAFAMISTITERAPWSLTLGIAMMAYGWTFQQGFLNYYISLGLAFFGVALVQRGRGIERALVLLLLALAWMAHPLGAVLLVGLGFYVAVSARLNVRNRPLLFTGAALALIGGSTYIRSHYPAIWPYRETLLAFFTHSGADQLLLYSSRYRLPSELLAGFVVACVALDVYTRRKNQEPRSIYVLPLQLYVLAFFAGIYLPSAVQLSAYAVPVGFLLDRLTSVTAILACCVLGAAKPQKWHLPCLAAIGAIFFLLLYGDTGTLNKMEAQMESYARAMPPGERVVASIGPAAGSRLLINHIVDRACIGHCFSYGNYEPSSQQFRVRALAGNPVVVSDSASFAQIDGGSYVVREENVPISEIYRCRSNEGQLCLHELKVGETNGLVDARLFGALHH